MNNLIKEKIALHLTNTNLILENYDVFLKLYYKCSIDKYFSELSQLEFIASFSEKFPVKTLLFFTASVNKKRVKLNPYLSELYGQISFNMTNHGITALLDIVFFDQFCNPKTAEAIYENYIYLENDPCYKRTLDNTQAGMIKIRGKKKLLFSYSTEIIYIIDLCKLTLQEMNKYLTINFNKKLKTVKITK